MKIASRIVLAITLLFVFGVGLPLSVDRLAVAAPEPEIVSSSWQLDFKYDTPQAIAVRDIDGTIKWYWYMTYLVTNNSEDDQLFVPDITIVDDSGRLLTDGQDVPTSVFRAIREKLESTTLLSSSQIVGKMLQGDDFAREGVVIWPVSDEDVDEVRIFVAGLSGETAEVVDPLTEETMLLRRTFMLRFATPGDAVSPEDQNIRLVQEREVMR